LRLLPHRGYNVSGMYVCKCKFGVDSYSNNIEKHLYYEAYNKMPGDILTRTAFKKNLILFLYVKYYHSVMEFLNVF
jgi:hypothetical protein